MEHEDNAHFDFLQNRLAESLQNAGSAGNAADVVAAELVPSIGPKSDEHDDDEEWKYIKEVQQSEKQQQQQKQHQFYGEKFSDADVDVAFGVGVGNGIGIGVGNGNGNGIGSAVGSNSDAYMSLGMDLSLGNGVGSAAGFRAAAAVEEEEDVEVIKHDGDFSSNSNTTTTSTTGEVEAQPKETPLPKPEQLRQEDDIDVDVDEEDEPSSVATTYGTSSLSEQQQEPEQLTNDAPADQFDNKENVHPTGQDQADLDLELEAHSQLNPNAVEFVPHFGSQPVSPPPSDQPLQALGRQLLVVGDDLVAESPRKGVRDCNMDTIAVPDECEFDTGADKRPHELEQEDDTFPAEVELQNGSEAYQQVEQQHIDHGPETSVDLDADLELSEPQKGTETDFVAPQLQDDIMKQSIYDDSNSNAPIEDILNSVQPLPQHTLGDEPLKEKELLNVEEKELVSQSPSIEELNQHQNQLIDPMQASFYLEHTSSDAFAQQAPDHDQSLLLDTSAPFSPLADEPAVTATTLELQPEQADIVDITPSPLSSSTEEKHLVEETKEQQQPESYLLSDNIEKEFNVGAPRQVRAHQI